MHDFVLLKESPKGFDETVTLLEQATKDQGFRVLHIHDVQATLAEKGFHIEPLKILEICNAKHAYSAVTENVLISLFMPCKINVYQQQGKTFVAALRPQVMSNFFPESNIDQLAADVNDAVKTIVEQIG